MADDNTQAGKTGEDEELTIIEVDKLPDPNEPAPAAPVDDKPAAEADDSDDDDEGDDGDARLGTDDEGERDDENANRRRRKQRRDSQRRARERLEADLAAERAAREALAQRLAALEGHTVQTTAAQLRAQHAQHLADMREAERIEALALEDGKGADAVTARNIREAAGRAAAAVEQQYTALTQQPQAPQGQAPAADPAVVRNALEWARANPWYNPQGNDEASTLTHRLDAQLVAEGYDPRTKEHWRELSNRLRDALAPGDDAPTPKRKGPPTSAAREHAPPTTRNEVYVSPERKQAMIDAGKWDDPVLRAKQLKAYRDFDMQQRNR